MTFMADMQNDFVNNIRRLENRKGFLQIFPAISFDFFIAIAPSTNYLFQIKKFSKTKSSKGFSIYLCFITLLSHSLRIFFWIGKKFKLSLLIQSILVVFMQLILIHLCVKYDDSENSYSDEIIYFKTYFLLIIIILLITFLVLVILFI